MLNYTKDGRAACIKFIADYIRENYPTQEEQESKRLGITVKQLRAKLVKDKVNKVVVKARVNLKWRNHLQERLQLNSDELVKATNTVLEIIENSLQEEKTIRIRNLGDFFLRPVTREDITTQNLAFIPEPDWIRELNKAEESTRLKKEYKRKLTREAVTEEF